MFRRGCSSGALVRRRDVVDFVVYRRDALVLDGRLLQEIFEGAVPFAGEINDRLAVLEDGFQLEFLAGAGQAEAAVAGAALDGTVDASADATLDGTVDASADASVDAAPEVSSY